MKARYLVEDREKQEDIFVAVESGGLLLWLPG
jgi:hypothetical protein